MRGFVEYLVRFAALLLVSLGARAGAPQGPVTINLDATRDKDEITVVLPSVKTLQLVSDKPYLVRWDNNRVSEIHRNAITLSVADAGLSLVKAEVNMSVFQKPGNYEVTIRYLSGGKDTTNFVFFLNRPAASLDVPATLHVTMEGDEVKAEALALHEKSGNSSIPLLTYNPVIIAGVDSGNLLNFNVDSRKIAAGGFLAASYGIDKALVSRLPLGPTTGKLWITAPQMEPVAVNVEIKHIKWKGRIVGCVLLGLLLGFFVRHFLKNGSDWDEAKSKGLEAVDKIQKETAKIKDETYRQSVETLLGALMPLLQGKAGYLGIGTSAADLTAKVNETLVNYKTARDVFLGKVNEQVVALSQFKSVFMDDSLDPELLAQLDPAITLFKAAQQSLKDFDPTTAEGQITQGARQTGTILDRLIRYYDGYAALPALVVPAELPGEVTLTVQQYFDGIKAQVDPLKVAGTGVSDKVAGLDKLFGLKDQLWDYLSKQVSNFFRVEDGSAAAEPLALLRKTVEEWLTGVEDIRTNSNALPDPRGYWHVGLLARLTAAWSAVKPQKAPGGGAMRESSRTEEFLLGDRAFVSAMQKPTPADQDLSVSFLTTDIQTLVKATWAQWVFYTVIRTILLALLMSLAAYGTYEATYTGEFTQEVGILLFAFSLDVSVDGLTALRDRKKP